MQTETNTSLPNIRSEDLIPIRQFAYRSDRQHFGMDGTVTVCDGALGREAETACEGAKTPLEGGTMNPRTGGLSFARGTKVPMQRVRCLPQAPSSPACLVQGLDDRDLSLPFWERRSRLRWVNLVGGSPTDARFPTPAAAPLPRVK